MILRHGINFDLTFTADDEFEDYADPHVVGRCRALYDYDASQRDELSIKFGKVIIATVLV